MASNIVVSTLMVLLSGSEQDLEDLWNTTGAVNDPAANKHELHVQDIIRDGNFRSALVDNWTNLSFDSVSVYGTNIFGDTLWETEFNVNGSSSPLSSWLAGGNIIGTTAISAYSQETTFSDENYRLRIGPSGSAEASWFAVTESGLSYGPLPQIFVPRSANRPFSNPVYVDGMLGCWYLADLTNVVYMYQDFLKMSPEECISRCGNNFSIAMLVGMNKCYCADIDETSPPTNDFSKCYMNCPFNTQLCGGFDSSAGSPYHVQGYALPGDVNTTVLYRAVYTNVSTTIQIDVSEIDLGSTIDPAFISEISVMSQSTTDSNYTMQYSEDACLNASGNMKDLSSDGASPTVFPTSGVTEVDILKVRCVHIIFSEALSDVTVELWGPDVTSEHIEASALVIRGKTEVPVTTSSTSTTSTSTTTTSTTSTVTSPSSSTSTTSTTTASYTNASTSSSSAVTTTTTSTEQISESPCICPCNITQLNLTDEQLQVKIIEMQRLLAVNVSTLSATIRKLTSAGDTRVSAVSIGYVGVGILAIVLLAVVLIDANVLLRDIRNLFDNVRTRFYADGDGH